MGSVFMKFKEKNRAIALRKSGKSYGEIIREIKVSKSTLSYWLREIKLTPEQDKRLYFEKKQKNAYRLAKLNQQKRIEKTKNIIRKAKKEFKSLYKNRLFLNGLMLYWAEGDKSERAEIVKFSNSDPAMIRLMMFWFRKICKVKNERFRVAINIHNLFSRKDVEKYWSEITEIPLYKFHKTQIKQTSLKRRRNILYNGTCSIRISDKDLFRRIKGWQLAFLDKEKINVPVVQWIERETSNL